MARQLDQLCPVASANCIKDCLLLVTIGSIDPDLDQFMVVERALQFSLEQKRLELLERKRAQLSQLRRDDASLDAEIERLAARLRAYAPAPVAPEPTPGLIQISERLADGRRAPASL